MGILEEQARVTAELERLAHDPAVIRVAAEVDEIIHLVCELDGTTYEMVAAVVLAVRRIHSRGDM